MAGILIIKCPHCQRDGVAAVALGMHVHRSGHARTHNETWCSIAVRCPICSHPMAGILSPSSGMNAPSFDSACSNWLNHGADTEAWRLCLKELWPKPPEPLIPAHVPDAVERAMLQAERNYPTPGNEEAAAIMYRRTLETALKDKFPSLTGSLAKRIKVLVKDRTLPEPIGDWADEIRALGNDAAHDDEVVDREQLTMIRGFADATLRYLYTLPAEVAARRKLT